MPTGMRGCAAQAVWAPKYIFAMQSAAVRRRAIIFNRLI
jgi:hypothetical protein